MYWKYYIIRSAVHISLVNVHNSLSERFFAPSAMTQILIASRLKICYIYIYTNLFKMLSKPQDYLLRFVVDTIDFFSQDYYFIGES